LYAYTAKNAKNYLQMSLNRLEIFAFYTNSNSMVVDGMLHVVKVKGMLRSYLESYT